MYLWWGLSSRTMNMVFRIFMFLSVYFNINLIFYNYVKRVISRSGVIVFLWLWIVEPFNFVSTFDFHFTLASTTWCVFLDVYIIPTLSWVIFLTSEFFKVISPLPLLRNWYVNCIWTYICHLSFVDILFVFSHLILEILLSLDEGTE